MTVTPLVSFVVPSFNYGRYLRECLDSILNQKGDHSFELIVVDDASKDDSVDIIKSYKDDRVKAFFHSVNQGHVVTINEGFSHARGEYIARIDSDDRYRKDFLFKTLPIFTEYADVGVVYGDISIINSMGEVTKEKSNVSGREKSFIGNEFIRLLAKNFLPAPTIIARKKLWRQILPIPEGLSFSDWYLNLQLARRTLFYYESSVLADYRVHFENHHTANARSLQEEETIFFILNKIFSESEADHKLQKMKMKMKRKIYATQFLDMGNKYFYFEYQDQALRCYQKAFMNCPTLLFSLEFARHFFGVSIGFKTYQFLKRLFKGQKKEPSR